MLKPFTDGFHFDSATATVDGFTLTARMVQDHDMGAPWDNEDGHGPVSDWTNRAKLPGERVLNEDRFGRRRYYDVAEAIQIAKRDGWDAEPIGQGAKGQRAARAVEADFRRLRGWCEGEWCYVGVVLSVSRNGIILDDRAASLWGIESDCRDYLLDVANELADEALDAAKAVLEALCVCDEEDEA